MKFLPVFYRIDSKKCLVVGAGTIAARKAELLLKAGATLRVVASEIGERVQQLASGHDVELLQREFHPATRFYASPNFHLTFTYYTGLPVQSLAPIRKSYLEHYPGPLVFLMPYLLLNGKELEYEVRQAALWRHATRLDV